MSSSCLIARRPLVAAVLLGLSLPVLADDAAQLDRVVVKGSRYLPEYQARETRSATKTDTPLVDVPQAATVVTEVTAVDTRANTITLKGPRGNEVTLDVVRDDLRDRLKKVKVGDLLKVTLTEAIAVNVRPRPQ